MAGKVTDRGERWTLAAALASMGTLTVKLAKASFIVDDVMSPADFAEADFDGYVPVVLSFLTLEAGNPGGKAVALFNDLIWTCASDVRPNLIYGFWLEDDAGEVWGVEKFVGSPRPMVVLGHILRIPFRLSLWSPV